MVFSIRGADVPLTAFIPEARNYQPNAWQLLKDLNINLIRCLPGAEGNVTHFAINYDVDWAENLNSFLAQAASNGVKVLFYQMGVTRWGNDLLLGILPYSSSYPYTPLAEAKLMIDKLAGDNALGHNFITDPRIFGWSTSNESDLTDPAALDWNLQLCDYIRSKGGKAWISHPRLVGTVDNWDSATQARVLGGHVDMIEMHDYGEWEYINYFARNTHPYGEWNSLYDYMKYSYQQMLNSSFTADKVFVGEIGIWLGYGTNEGLTEGVTFTAQDRINIYTDVLNAARDVGIKNICFHIMFSEIGETPNYGIAKDPTSGVGYWDDNLASIIRIAYAAPVSGCFIATACYGSPTHYKVNRLRRIKDELVAKSAMAQFLYALYYVFSPPVANFIRERENFKKPVRKVIEWLMCQHKKISR